MNSSLNEWTEANQAYLTAEFDRIKALLKGAEAPTHAPFELPAPAAIESLAAAFTLSDFERDLLLLCAGVEMDSQLAGLCAEAGGGRPQATFGIALGALPDPHWSALAPVRPLRRWRLLEPADDSVMATARLHIDERVLHYLAGINYLDPRLQPLVRRIPEARMMAGGQEAAAKEIAAFLASAPLPVVQLSGTDLHGKRDVAAAAAGLCGLQLHAVSSEDLPSSPHELEALTALWERESALLDSALLVEVGPELQAAAIRFVERTGGLILVAARDPLALTRPDLRWSIDKPERQDQIGLWRSVLDGEHYEEVLEGVASEFRLSAQDIQRVGARLEQEVPDNPKAAIWRACRGVERRHLDGLAQRIEPAAGWEDLVLPEPQKNTLRQISSHVRHRLKVYDSWGFESKSARGLGISALFAGESGTGKTMAAEVLANELHLDLYRIDLAAVVSKYIGETEKNLGRVFDAAEGGGVILLFDEADALFGKRSEVKDSHDRYANIEVSYLLQRMEAYRGLAILTTNQKAALDTAFQRRIRFMLQFPFPDAAEREEIWRRVFPDDTPTQGLDHSKLARLHMAGGHIRNIALNGAFHAAAAGESVTMKHLLQAARAEAARTERGLTEAETRGWV